MTTITATTDGERRGPHLAHEGERRVIQVAWLTSEEEKLRKTRRGKLSRLFKKLFGGVDKRLGAGRDRNAAHRD